MAFFIGYVFCESDFIRYDGCVYLLHMWTFFEKPLHRRNRVKDVVSSVIEKLIIGEEFALHGFDVAAL